MFLIEVERKKIENMNMKYHLKHYTLSNIFLELCASIKKKVVISQNVCTV